MSSDAVAFLGDVTKVAGKETVNGRPAIHLVAEDLNFPQSSDDSEFLLKKMHLWVDSEHYVPLKLEMDGVATSDGQSRNMRIEREDQPTGPSKVAGRCRNRSAPSCAWRAC